MPTGTITISQYTAAPTAEIDVNSSLEVRGWYSRPFISVDGVTPVFGNTSNGEQGPYYFSTTPTLNASGGLVVPAHDVQITVGANPTGNYFEGLWVDGAFSQLLMPNTQGATGWQIPSVYGDPIAYDEIATYNRARRLVYAPDTYFTADQVIQEIERLAGNFDYMAVGVNGIGQASFPPVVASVPIVLMENDPRVGSYVNVLAYAAVGNDSTDNTVPFTNAQTAAALAGTALYIPVGTFRLFGGFSFTVPVVFAPGASVIKHTGGSFTFSKSVAIDDFQQHFASTSTTIVHFTNQRVYPDWFTTNTVPGTTDMTAAINAADASVVSGVDSDFIGQTVAWQGEVWFKPSETYRINSELTYRGAPWNLQWAVIDYHGTSVAISAIGTNLHRKIVNIKNGIIYTSNVTGTSYGLCMSYNMRSYEALSDVIFLGFPGPGVYFSGPEWDLSFYDMQILSCGDVTGSGMDFASQVTAATNANPCVITTDRAHGFATSQSIYLSGFASTLGTAINGARTIIALSATTFSVPVNTTATSVYGGTGAYASGVTDINQFNWFNPVFENNGTALSGKGGAVDNTGAFPGAFHQWASFGGLFTSNLGLAEVAFMGGSNINFYAPYVESAGTGQVSNGFYFNNVSEAGCHHPYFTGGPNAGSAINFTNSTVGEISNVRNTRDSGPSSGWDTSVNVSDFARMSVLSLGSLTPTGTDVITATRGQINWPYKNNNQLPLWYQPAPNTQTGSVTLTVANLITGIIVGTPPAAGGNVNYQLPAGSLVEASGQYAVNDSFDWTLMNKGSAAGDTITLTAGAAHTIEGNAVVQSANAATGAIYGNSGRFRTRKTATDTWITYRIS